MRAGLVIVLHRPVSAGVTSGRIVELLEPLHPAVADGEQVHPLHVEAAPRRLHLGDGAALHEHELALCRETARLEGLELKVRGEGVEEALDRLPALPPAAPRDGAEPERSFDDQAMNSSRWARMNGMSPRPKAA